MDVSRGGSWRVAIGCCDGLYVALLAAYKPCRSKYHGVGGCSFDSKFILAAG